MYYVVRWDTDERVQEFERLVPAKRKARGMGHTGEDVPILTGYPPIACVQNEDGEVIYNPRFGKLIRAEVGGLIDSVPSDYF